jgi:hypothetical protein
LVRFVSFFFPSCLYLAIAVCFLFRVLIVLLH